VTKDDTATKPKELTGAQFKAIPHMLAARSFEDAAKASGVHVRTLLRWNSDPLFRAAVSEAEMGAIDYAVRRLIAVSDKAVDTLEKVLDDDTASKSIKVRAALGILDQLARLRELRNIEIRLTALEAIYYGDKKPHEY
jgi:hypothetical protein